MFKGIKQVCLQYFGLFRPPTYPYVDIVKPISDVKN